MNIPCTLTINREGTFAIFPDSDTETQCGIVGKREYKYFVSIEATNDFLTPEGFIMDNALVDKYFQDSYHKKRMACESCEIMAQKAIEYFREQFDGVGKPVLKRVYVRLHGTPVSFIEGKWENK